MLLKNPIPIQVPSGLSIETLMRSFEIGHGYKWLILDRKPVLIVSGIPSNDFMPELFLVKRTLWIRYEDSEHKDRLEHTLKRLNGGGSLG